MKKLVSLLLCLAMLLSLASVAVADNSTVFTAENPGSLKVAVYERGDMDSDYGTAIDNYWTRWIKEKVWNDLHINLEYVAVARTKADDNMTTMLAGGTAPDIIFYYDYSRVYQFAAEGGFADLTEAVELYGANLKEMLGSVLPYGVIDGKQQAIPALRASTGHIAAKIRKDWCDKIGHELKIEDGIAYITASELMEIMTAWKEQGICEYPMALCPESGYEMESMSTVFGAFINHETFDEKMLATKPVIMWDGVKEGFGYLNQLYNAGLIQPDWAQYTDDTQYKNWVTNGKVGFWSHSAGHGMGINEYVYSLYLNDSEAEVVPVVVTNDQGVPALVDQYVPYGMDIVVPAYSEHVTEAVMYLDWLADYDNYEIIQYGFENEHFVYLENGVHDTRVVAENAVRKIQPGDLAIVFNGNPKADVYEAEQRIRAEANNGFLADLSMAAGRASRVNTYIPYSFNVLIQAETDYSVALGEKIVELQVKAITCPAEEFDATYDGLINEYLEMGGQEVIDEKTAVYDAQ